MKRIAFFSFLLILSSCTKEPTRTEVNNVSVYRSETSSNHYDLSVISSDGSTYKMTEIVSNNTDGTLKTSEYDSSGTLLFYGVTDQKGNLKTINFNSNSSIAGCVMDMYLKCMKEAICHMAYSKPFAWLPATVGWTIGCILNFKPRSTTTKPVVIVTVPTRKPIPLPPLR